MPSPIWNQLLGRAALDAQVLDDEVLDRVDGAARDDLVLARDRVRRDVGELLERRERGRLARRRSPASCAVAPLRTSLTRLGLDARDEVDRLEEAEHVHEVRQHDHEAERARDHHHEHGRARHELRVQRQRRGDADDARDDVVRHHGDVRAVAQEHLRDARVPRRGELHEERDDRDHDAEHGGGHRGEAAEGIGDEPGLEVDVAPERARRRSAHLRRP